jgi:hypothetical protein
MIELLELLAGTSSRPALIAGLLTVLVCALIFGGLLLAAWAGWFG